MAINGDLNRATAVELAASTAGGAIGATLGSVVPVVGTAIGGIVGSFLGAKLGELANRWMDEDKITPIPAPAAPAPMPNEPQAVALQVDVHDKPVNIKQVGIQSATGPQVDMGISLPSSM
ncbi:glycine zipper domain-containing protein [Moritella viscosa]|uniref:Tail tape measure protein n=1 Tax=Moritella viscosa TaxID=80854 RepID=A0A1K9YWF9_9GAMM|nr:glycine zipper domain-containing protein [Moritella viscosa]SGY86819.1 Tail tape measure protein [Moritella viscosa]